MQVTLSQDQITVLKSAMDSVNGSMIGYHLLVSKTGLSKDRIAAAISDLQTQLNKSQTEG